ncbi:MAG: hypothetical protein KH135_05120 [Firmicutes bacterium]|nr:hypothetical protein [Bacillota bacterium]
MRKVKRNGFHPEVRKYYLLGVVSIFIIMVLGIGYAILTQNLNITGTANISSSWDILFTSVTEGTLTDSKTISKNITDGTSLTLNVELNQPGASATYNVTVANRGSLDASLASIKDVEEGNKASPTAIKYKVEGINTGDSLLANTEQTFQVIVTWDKSVDITSDHMEKEIKVTLNYEQKTGTPDVPTPSVQNATELITNKNTVGNTEGLFTDTHGNIHYRGSNSEVKNYVTFNNETWRIIGVFDGRIKLIKNESYSKIEWDTSEMNNWDNSSLNRILNGAYYDSLLLEARTVIDSNTYYLGGFSNVAGLEPAEIYSRERGNIVYNGNPTTTILYVGLMYPSDYVYAASSSCTKLPDEYHLDANCSTTGNWLYSQELTNGIWEWTLTPSSGLNSDAFVISKNSGITSVYTTESHIIRPVVYLKSNVNITAGTGTSSNPYQFAI